MSDTYDFIIIGAGSAGCVLANRLTQCGKYKVLLIEAGGSDNNLFVKMPAALSYPMNTRRFNWGYSSEPEPFLEGRQLDCPRGKGLGGSSSINGMVFVRGNRSDFDDWERNGARGWGYEGCLPYFKKLESWDGLSSSYRGTSGLVRVNCGNEMRLNPLYSAFIQAGIEAGFTQNPDYNAESQEGFAPMQMNVDRGIRASTAHAYLTPARKRANLTLRKKTYVERIIFEGKKAVGVEYVKNGLVGSFRAHREVIMCAGAIGSPHLLQLSGIGPAPVLTAAGVGVLHHLPGVGANLQDHLEVYFQYKCTKPITLNGKLGPLSKALIGAQWLIFKKGLGISNQFESCGFVRSSPQKPAPDTQFHFLPAAIRYDGKAPFKGHGYQVHVGPNKPQSRGGVTLRSKEARCSPSIRFNYLQAPQDVEDWRNVIRLTRDILTQPAFTTWRGEEIQPGIDIGEDDDALDAWVRANVESAYHPSCTCKIGADEDPMAVLDEACRVRGIGGLRVVDASIFPRITNGNLNAPTMMSAEKAADLILS